MLPMSQLFNSGKYQLVSSPTVTPYYCSLSFLQPVFIILFDIFYLFTVKNYELDRNQIELHEILGEGQFGDVHRGTVQIKEGNLIPVAVKTCKGDADVATADKFLEEARKSFIIFFQINDR